MNSHIPFKIRISKGKYGVEIGKEMSETVTDYSWGSPALAPPPPPPPQSLSSELVRGMPTICEHTGGSTWAGGGGSECFPFQSRLSWSDWGSNHPLACQSWWYPASPRGGSSLWLSGNLGEWPWRQLPPPTWWLQPCQAIWAPCPIPPPWCIYLRYCPAARVSLWVFSITSG